MSAEDIVLVGALVFMLGLAFFASHFVINTMYDNMLNNTVLNQTAEVRQVLNAGKTISNQMDYVTFAVFIGLVLGIVITAWFIGGNTLFTVFYFFVWIIAVFLSAIFSNTWQTVSQASIFGGTIASFPITNNILTNLPIYITVVGFLGIIAMFAKPYFAGSGGGDIAY